MDSTELTARVKAHALANYSNGGWDVVVECYEDAEIAAEIGDATTFEEAIKAFEPLIDVWSDRQADARNSAF